MRQHGAPYLRPSARHERLHNAAALALVLGALTLPGAIFDSEDDMPTTTPDTASDAEYLADNVVRMPARQVTEAELDAQDRQAMLIALHRRRVEPPAPASAGSEVIAEPTGHHRIGMWARAWLALRRWLD